MQQATKHSTEYATNNTQHSKQQLTSCLSVVDLFPLVPTDVVREETLIDVEWVRVNEGVMRGRPNSSSFRELGLKRWGFSASGIATDSGTW